MPSLARQFHGAPEIHHNALLDLTRPSSLPKLARCNLRGRAGPHNLVHSGQHSATADSAFRQPLPFGSHRSIPAENVVQLQCCRSTIILPPAPMLHNGKSCHTPVVSVNLEVMSPMHVVASRHTQAAHRLPLPDVPGLCSAFASRVSMHARSPACSRPPSGLVPSPLRPVPVPPITRSVLPVPVTPSPWLQTALKLQPNFADACNNLASIFSQMGDVPRAVEYYTAALRINPRIVDVHQNLGDLWLSQVCHPRRRHQQPCRTTAGGGELLRAAESQGEPIRTLCTCMSSLRT